MKGLDKIIEKILSEGRTAAERTRAQAQLSADEILESQRSEGEYQKAAIIERAKEQSEEIMRAAMLTAGLDARKAKLAARQDLVERAFDQALAQLSSMPPERSAQVVAQQAAPLIKTGEEVIMLSPGVHEAIASLLPDALKAAGAPAAKVESSGEVRGGGFILRDGEIEMNCTFEASLRQYREELEKQVVDALFA